MEKVACIIDLPLHCGTPATWRDDNSPTLVVCTRHRKQYEERSDEFGPFNWQPVNQKEK